MTHHPTLSLTPLFHIAACCRWKSKSNEVPKQAERKSLFGSFINDVYTNSKARDKEIAEREGKQALASDALFGSGDDGDDGDAAEDGEGEGDVMNKADGAAALAPAATSDASGAASPALMATAPEEATAPALPSHIDTSAAVATSDLSASASRLAVSSPVAYKQVIRPRRFAY